MHRRLVCGLIVGAALTLAGCGGGHNDNDNDEPEAVVGHLVAGGVSGVRYETATQSGATDSTGAFHYVPGETVRFSVGGVELGAVPGANQVTLFRLAGTAPVTTTPALRRELDRAVHGQTPFLRAINLCHFLIAFDADGNPDNGLDVSAANAALANASLDFDQPLYVFPAALNLLRVENNHNIPLWRPVVQLYRAIGVTIPARMPRLEQVRGGTGLFPGFGGYDVSYRYRGDGLRESMGQDTNLDGVPEYGTGITYEGMGRIASSHTEFGDFFEGTQFISDTEIAYDARGRYTRQEEHLDLRGDGSVDQSAVTEVEGDRFTGVERQTTRIDAGNDGVVDSIDVIEGSIDEALHVETYRVSIDSNADGITDSNYVVIYRFDSLLRFESLTEERDDNGDGVVDYRTRQSATYTEVPRTRRTESTEDIGGDGTIDRSWVNVSTLDAVGNELSRQSEADYFGGDGVVDERSMVERTYDADRRELTAARSLDYDADGVVDQLDSGAFTYSGIGGVLTATREFDFQADGVSEYRYEQRYEYGVGGELTGWGAYDLDTSTTDPSSWMTAENIDIADGVRTLAQSYFEFNTTLSIF